MIKLDKDNLVLNIELKSEDVGVEAIQNQLEKNKYYLKHLAPNVQLYTFVESTKELYKYTPVSYTHLDVYKRQEEASVAA